MRTTLRVLFTTCASMTFSANADAEPIYKISGAITYTQKKESTGTFTAVVSGSKYRLTIDDIGFNDLHATTKDGVKLKWMDIGSDGRDTYLMRAWDAVQDPAGHFIMRGKVVSGTKPPDDRGNEIAQLMWVAFASMSDIERRGQVLDVVFPRALFALETALPVHEVRLDAEGALPNWGTPSRVTFYAPNYLNVDPRILPSSGTLRAHGIDVKQITPSHIPGNVRMPFPKGFEDGYKLAEYVAGEPHPNPPHVPTDISFKRYVLKSDANKPSDLLLSTAINIRIEHIEQLPAAFDDFLPSIGIDALVNDMRLGKSSGNPLVYKTSSAGWYVREDEKFREYERKFSGDGVNASTTKRALYLGGFLAFQLALGVAYYAHRRSSTKVAKNSLT